MLKTANYATKTNTRACWDRKKVVKGPYRDYDSYKKLEQRYRFFRLFPVMSVLSGGGMVCVCIYVTTHK